MVLKAYFITVGKVFTAKTHEPRAEDIFIIILKSLEFCVKYDTLGFIQLKCFLPSKCNAVSREPFENIKSIFLFFFYMTQAPAERRTRDLGGNSITSPQKRTRHNSEVAAEASPRKSSRLASAAPVEANPRKSPRVISTPQKIEPIMTPSPRKQARVTNVDTPEGSPRKSSRLENISQKGASKGESPRNAAKSIISTPSSRPVKCESPRKTAKDQTTAQLNKQKTSKTETDTPRKTARAKLKVPQVSQRPCLFLSVYFCQ